jgi:hypothetical protein
MSIKHKDNQAPVVSLKNESSRQRWELFHRAIAHAKESNHAAVADADSPTEDTESSSPVLTIVR